MVHNDKELKLAMDSLYNELIQSNNKKTDKLIIAKAVQLGMQYKEYLLKSGIEIVFKTAK